MSTTNDDLLFGTGRQPAEDDDHDGVSNAQERLDGTDPNDAADHIRRDTPVAGPQSYNPNGDVDNPEGEIDHVVDVGAMIPVGQSIEQNLLVGMDGTPITGGHGSLGFAQGDALMDGRLDENSPFNAQRNPFQTGATTGGGPPPPTPSDTVIGSGGGGSSEKGGLGGSGHAPGDMPPGWGPSKWDLVSAGGNKPVKPFVEKPGREKNEGAKPAEAPSVLDDITGAIGSVGTQIKETAEAAVKLVTDATTAVQNFMGVGEKKYDTGEGDASGGPGVITEADVERITNDGVTRFVDGVGGPKSFGPGDVPKGKLDPVTDPSPEGDHGGVVGTGTTPVAPPGSEISKPIDPTVHSGGPTPSGGATGGGGGGTNSGLAGGSHPAMAAAAAADASSETMTTVGNGPTGGGIQSVVPDDLTGVSSAPATDPTTTGIIIPDVSHTNDVGIIIPDVDRPADAGIIIPDVGHTIVDQQIVEASPMQVASAGDPVADAMATAELPSHQVPVDALPGVTVEEGFGPGQTPEALLDGD